MKNLTIHKLIEITGATLTGGEGRENAEISSVVIDSRKAVPGSLFAALPGNNTDGVLYINSAFEKGAVCALAQRLPDSPAGPVALVQDPGAALRALAAWYRGQFALPVTGVTGSVGKTTAKEMVSAVLSQKYSVLKTHGNLNNDLGVPLTLFGLSEEHGAAVVEMGISHFGEMRVLTEMVRPDYAVYTVIGDAHLEFLGDRAGVLRAKSELLEGMPPDGTVFLNGDDEFLKTMECVQRKVFYGLGESCGVRASNIRSTAEGHTLCDVLAGGNSFPVEIPALGEHMVYNALAGAAVGLAFGLTGEEIAAGIASFASVGSRDRAVDTGRFTLIDDCYNANPTSVRSALRSLAAREGRKVCILGDMLELGSDSERYHRECGKAALDCGAALVLTCGELSRYTAEAAGALGHHFAAVPELIAALPGILRDGDVILVKASHSMRFEAISQAIEKM